MGKTTLTMKQLCRILSILSYAISSMATETLSSSEILSEVIPDPNLSSPPHDHHRETHDFQLTNSSQVVNWAQTHPFNSTAPKQPTLDQVLPTATEEHQPRPVFAANRSEAPETETTTESNSKSSFNEGMYEVEQGMPNGSIEVTETIMEVIDENESSTTETSLDAIEFASDITVNKDGIESTSKATNIDGKIGTLIPTSNTDQIEYTLPEHLDNIENLFEWVFQTKSDTVSKQSTNYSQDETLVANQNLARPKSSEWPLNEKHSYNYTLFENFNAVLATDTCHDQEPAKRERCRILQGLKQNLAIDYPELLSEYSKEKEPIQQTHTEERTHIDEYDINNLAYDQQILHYTLQLDSVVLKFPQVNLTQELFQTDRLPTCISNINAERIGSDPIPISHVCPGYRNWKSFGQLTGNNLLPILIAQLERNSRSALSDLLGNEHVSLIATIAGSHVTLSAPMFDIAQTYLHLSGDPVRFVVCKPSFLERSHMTHSRTSAFAWVSQRLVWPAAVRDQQGCSETTLHRGSALVTPPGSAIAWYSQGNARILQYHVLNGVGVNAFHRRIETMKDVGQLGMFASQTHVDLLNQISILIAKLSNEWDRPMYNNLPYLVPIESSQLHGSHSFTSWKEQRRWATELRDAGLRITTPLHIRAIGRTNGTLAWALPSAAASKHWSSRTPQLTVCAMAMEHDEQPTCQSIDKQNIEIVSDPPEVVVHLSSLLPATAYKFRAQACNSISPLFEKFDHKKNEHQCSSWNTYPSLWSHTPVVTNSITVPWAVPDAPEIVRWGANDVTLTWKRPFDDGGAWINSYTVWYELNGIMEVAGGLAFKHQEMECNPCSAIINNLLPGKEYKFVVSSTNSILIGEHSPMSPASQSVTLSGGNRVTVGGVGSHFSHYSSIRQLVDVAGHTGRHLATIPAEYQQDVLVTMNDTDHSITLHQQDNEEAEDSRVEAWACHHSPKKYAVHAPLVIAEPNDGCDTLLANAQKAKGHIVVVARGGCALLHKVLAVQKSGGLGVIITDHWDGSCGDAFDHKCSSGDWKKFNQGFASNDPVDFWSQVHIPSVLVSYRLGDLLASLRVE